MKEMEIIKNIREKFLNFLKTKKIIAFIGYKSLHTSQMGKKFLQKKQKLKVHAARDCTAAGRHGGPPREYLIFFSYYI